MQFLPATVLQDPNGQFEAPLATKLRVACITASGTIIAMCQEARLLCLWGAHCCFCLLPRYRRAVASCSNLGVEALASLTTMWVVMSHVHLSIPHNRLQACQRASNEVDSVLDSSRRCVTCCATSASCHEYRPQGGILVHCCTVHQPKFRGEFQIEVVAAR